MPPIEKEKIAYFLYARKSSESEDRQIQSIEDQVDRLTILAKNFKLEIKEVFTEKKSAKLPHNREGFAEMLKRIQKGEANGILVWEINRLSRNPIDSGEISWLLQQGVIKCIQTIDRRYLPDDNVLLFNVESGMANQYIIDLKKNCRRGLESKANRGWLPTLAPLGYLNSPLDHTIIEDPERFPIVRRMWDLLLTGNYSAPQILGVANNEWGLRSIRRKRSGGSELSMSGIYKLFTNLFYTGLFKWSERTFPGKHKPMITIEEYDKAQIILGRKGKPRIRRHEFAYTGLISCGECHGMITATEKTKLIKKSGEIKQYVYYHCTHKKKSMDCKQSPLTLPDLENQMLLNLQRYTILPKFEQWAIEILNSRTYENQREKRSLEEMQKKSLSDTRKELENLIRMRCRELIDETSFIQEQDILQKRIGGLTSQLSVEPDQKSTENTQRAFHFLSNAFNAFTNGTSKSKREIISAVGQNFSLKDKILNVEAVEWLKLIEKDYSSLEEEYNRIELNKSLDSSDQNSAIASLILRMSGIVEAIRTSFEADPSPVYIPDLEENIPPIKKVA